VDFKLCLRTNVWVAAAQALVAAISDEANILLSLDLSSRKDGSQLPGKAALTNYGQGSTLAHTQTAHTLTRVPCAKITPHMQDSTVNSECGVLHVACVGAISKANSDSDSER
jgi:hypothetical protein